MKILFVIQDFALPSSRVRVLNLIPELEKNGIQCFAIPYPRKMLARLRLYLQCRNADMVVIQKRLISPINLLVIRLLSKHLAFDFDDAIYTKQQSNQVLTNKTRYKKFKNIIRKSDLILAGNRVLAKMAEPFNKHVAIIPSAVEVRGIPTKTHATVGNHIVIGWVGTAVNLPYLELLAPTLQRLAKDYPIELRIICSESIQIQGINLRFIPWTLESQEQEIAQFDIGIMPLPDSEHAAGKCGYKALQYMAAAVPAVASDVGINNEIISHMQDGMLAQRIDDFYPALHYLITQPEERKRLGLAGRARVEQSYSIESVARELTKILSAEISTKP